MLEFSWRSIAIACRMWGSKCFMGTHKNMKSDDDDPTPRRNKYEIDSSDAFENKFTSVAILKSTPDNRLQCNKCCAVLRGSEKPVMKH